MSSGYRGRFAPSPTGRIHLGNARSALLGWLHARSERGSFLLRIEDLDRGRCRPEFVDTLYRDLEYLGLGWDETPVFQSARTEAYEAALAKLRASGRIYDCFCSRAEIARAASAPHGPLDEGPIYPGTCRAEGAPKPKDRKPAQRFIPSPGEWAFEDLIHGRVTQDVVHSVGDFVVRKNDGVASYQLAVVVDDAASGITHVLRGDDLLASTPRQLQLYDALGMTAPAFAHVPLLIGEDGKRMAKREGASAIAELRERGIPASRVIGLLAKWSGLSDDGAPVTAAELARTFSLTRVRRDPTVVAERDLQELVG